MIASLPMYDWPELALATDGLWRGLADRLRGAGLDAPRALERNMGRETMWLHPDLLLSQTCGFPFAMRLRGRVRLIATPRYDVDGCDGADYRSLILVHRDCRAEDLARLQINVIAVNSFDSQSGYNALVRTLIRDTGQAMAGKTLLQSSSHRRSIRAVAEGAATVCAVDPLCFAFAMRFDPGLVAQVRILTRSDPVPTLPLITSAKTDDAALETIRNALDALLDDPVMAEHCATLKIAGFERLTDDDYNRIDLTDPTLLMTA